DAPNAEQRLTELQSDLAGQTAQLTEAEAILAAFTARADAERRRVNRLGGAELTAPVAGLFWEVLAANRESVQRGDPVARIVDCGSTMVTLSVTESVFNRLSIGDAAVFRPRGMRETFEGTVERLAGAGAATIYRNLAIAPSQRHLERHDVSLSVPGLRADPALGCAVGRTGRVFFDARPLDRLRALLP
ncbi:MAG: HlyD family efflux transporter periplasmic adaptor subunit, partial [Paracoccus sp. (in: a-proteobacteria)]